MKKFTNSGQFKRGIYMGYGFKKGCKSFMEGKHHKPETIEKIRQAKLGKSSWNKGLKYGHQEICPECKNKFFVYPHLIKKGLRKFCSIKCSNLNKWKNPEYRKHMSKVHMGGNEIVIKKLIAYVKSDIGRKKASERFKGKPAWNKDRKFPEFSGENHPNWIKDRAKLKKGDDRPTSSSVEWTRQVKKRDNYQCKINNQDCKGQLSAHHILNWQDFPELRYDTNNGITLCHAHHPKGRAKEQLLAPTFQELISQMK
jgi:hypothetical protein